MTEPTARQASKRSTLPPEAEGTQLPAVDASPGTGGQPAAPTSTPAPHSSGGFQPGQALGGLIVGLYLWGFAENWIRGGSGQAWAWVKSKFTNQTTGTGKPLPIGPNASGGQLA